jgi:hypothetical protein
MVGLDDDGVHLPSEQLAADVFFQGRGIKLHEATLAWESLDNALVFEFGVSLGDRITVEAQ